MIITMLIIISNCCFLRQVKNRNGRDIDRHLRNKRIVICLMKICCFNWKSHWEVDTYSQCLVGVKMAKTSSAKPTKTMKRQKRKKNYLKINSPMVVVIQTQLKKKLRQSLKQLQLKLQLIQLLILIMLVWEDHQMRMMMMEVMRMMRMRRRGRIICRHCIREILMR